MLIVGYSGQALTKYIRALARHAVTIRRAMGIVIVVFSDQLALPVGLRLVLVQDSVVMVAMDFCQH